MRVKANAPTNNMRDAPPIVLVELLNLIPLGFTPSAIQYGSITLESGRFMCCCERVRGVRNQGSVVVVDLTQGRILTRLPFCADAAILNPNHQVIIPEA